MKNTALTLTFLLVFLGLNAQTHDSTQIDTNRKNKRLKILLIPSGITYGISLIALDRLWYKNHPKETFHFFDDSHEWKQMDKFGHCYSTYQISQISLKALQWAGVKPKKAYLWGALTGTILMLPIEIMDGFSAAYGTSWSDLIANSLGSILIYTQYSIWNKPKIHLKFSFFPSSFATLRPNVLGKNIPQQLLKDYNAQRYWLSFDLYSLFGNKQRIPKWLNLAIGYGAHEMVYAQDDENEMYGYHAYRQYYIGIDWDLLHIKTNKPWIKTLLFFANMIRLPAPAIEFSKQQIRLKLF